VSIRSRHRFDDLDWLRVSLAFVLVVPCLTPGMHDRYFYPADMLSMVYAFYLPRRFYVPILVTLISALSYLPYLFGMELIPMRFLALVLLLPVGVVVYDLTRSLHSTGRSDKPGHYVISFKARPSSGVQSPFDDRYERQARGAFMGRTAHLHST
jgi:uncharacterized membrane protein